MALPRDTRSNWATAIRHQLSPRRLAIVLVAVGVLWRAVRYGLGFPIWGDEAFVAVNFLIRDYAGMIEPLKYGQIVPLVFMWAELAVCRALGTSEWALRLLPFLAGVGALLLFAGFAFRTLPRWAAVLALGFLAAAYYPVRHGAEVKPYATDLLISMAFTILAWRVIERPTLGRWAALWCLALAAPWCSYPIAFVAAAAAIVLGWRAVRQGKGSPAHWFVYCAVFGGSFLAMYFLYAKPHAEYAARLTEIQMWTETFPPWREPWKLPLWFLAMHTGNMMAYPVGGKAPASLATFVLVVLGAVRLWRTKPALVALLLAPLPFTLIAAAFERYPYGGSARTSLYMAPAFCLLGGYGLYVALQGVVALRRRHWPGLQRLGRELFRRDLRLSDLVQFFAFVLVVAAGVGIYRDMREPSKSSADRRSRDAVVEVAAKSTSDDRWIVFNATEPADYAQPVDYAPYLADWAGAGAQFVFDALRFAPTSITWAPRPESIGAPPQGRVWLLSYRSVKADFPEKQLAAYVATLIAKFGEPQHTQYFIKEKAGRTEALDVYEFPRAAPTKR